MLGWMNSISQIDGLGQLLWACMFKLFWLGEHTTEPGVLPGVSLFWNVPMRAQWVAVTLTGIALGGISHVFTVTLGMLSGLGRKLNDEAETIESPANLQRVA